MRNFDISSIAILLSMVQMGVNAQITWLGNPFAKSTVNPVGETILQPSNSGAQFPYSKNSASGPLVSVKLTNTETGFSETLQTDFDMIAQKCSCYWIDMKDLVSLFGNKIKTSRFYRLKFDSPSYQALSGYFAIATSDDTDIGTYANPTSSTPTVPGSTTTTQSTTQPTTKGTIGQRSSADKKSVHGIVALLVIPALLL